MATVKTSASANFDATQKARRSTAAVIKNLDGVAIDKMTKYTNLVGDWKDADPDKVYAGLVPTINGKERFDLAILTFDLLTEDVPTYPDGDKVVFQTPSDDLHRLARKYLDDNANATYDAWLTYLAGLQWDKVEVFSYSARNKKGGRWNNAIFGASTK